MAIPLLGSDGKVITSGESGASRRLDVSARSDSRTFYTSRDAGQVYAWAGLYNSSDGETVLLVKNTSTTLTLVIVHMEVVSDAITRVRVHLPTSEITPAGGAVITGINLNTASTNAAPALGRQNENTNSVGDVIEDTLIAANEPHEVEYSNGLRITQNKSIAIDVATGATALGGATIIGYFEVPGT